MSNNSSPRNINDALSAAIDSTLRDLASAELVEARATPANPPSPPAAAPSCTTMHHSARRRKTNPPLTARHYSAARLLLQGLPISAVAKQLRIHRNTLTRWLKSPGFDKELQRQTYFQSRSETAPPRTTMHNDAPSQAPAQYEPTKSQILNPQISNSEISNLKSQILGHPPPPCAIFPNEPIAPVTPLFQQPIHCDSPASSPQSSPMNRRQFMILSGAALASTTLAQIPDPASAIAIDPAPLFELSPHLYMHFMEPLGVTDSSIEASWDHAKNRWRPDLVSLTKELAPAMMRWGGLYCSYYKWREGVGPRNARKPLYNLVWGGVETNQIGTAEFVDFCRQVNSDPLMCVNFECEGHKPWMTDPLGSSRFADAKEAAEWIDYCNNPDNAERKAHGHADPLTIPFWQIGNETSYSNERFKQDQAIAKTIEFAKAMRGADKNIKLIGWGDSGWMKNMIERAGEHLQYVAFHNLFDPTRPDPKSPLKNSDWRKDPAATWDAFMNGYKQHERKVIEMRQQADGKMPLALTECHYAPQGRNRCEMLSTWACGVSYARFLNLHERHGDVLKIANISDFCGTRWQTNAVMLPVPNGRAYAMPIARVMQLYRLHSGKNFVKVTNTPADLDITASRTEGTVFIHVINTNRTQSRQASLAITGLKPTSAKAFTIATDPEFEIMSADRDPMKIRESNVELEKPISFAAASVTALEVQTHAQA